MVCNGHFKIETCPAFTICPLAPSGFVTLQNQCCPKVRLQLWLSNIKLSLSKHTECTLTGSYSKGRVSPLGEEVSKWGILSINCDGSLEANCVTQNLGDDDET